MSSGHSMNQFFTLTMLWDRRRNEEDLNTNLIVITKVLNAMVWLLRAKLNCLLMHIWIGTSEREREKDRKLKR